MTLSERFPFYSDLDGLPHGGPIDHSVVAPRESDTVVSNQWSIRFQESGEAGDDALENAAHDLQRFLRLAFGLDLAVAKTYEDNRAILLRVAAIDSDSSASLERHRITVTERSVAIDARGAAGVLQGVFHIENLMRERGGPVLSRETLDRRPLFHRRIHRSAVSPFHVEEAAGFRGMPYERPTYFGKPIVYQAHEEEDAGLGGYYADHILLGLARHGFNGIWLRGALRKLSRTRLFPAADGYPDRALPQIRDLCRRAAGYGMHVYIYLNEPMGVPEKDPFFADHPGLMGSRVRHYQEVRCLCTSSAGVLKYLEDGMAYLFAQVPELAGAILISASEYPSHCWCHVRPGTQAELAQQKKAGFLCPRCADRDPREIVNEVVGALHRGMKTAKPEGELIAWNWSWNFYEADPQPGILAALPDDAIVMGDFERGLPTKALDMEYRNEEYSLKVIGPSERFTGVVSHQRGRGMPTYAKLQIGTTHENGSVPYLPVLQSIGAKYRALAKLGAAGMMTCWNFGNMPCMATEAANAFAWSPQAGSVDDVLTHVAARHFGAAAATVVVDAWQRMYEGLQASYPATNRFLYHTPLSRGPAFPWTLEPLGETFPPSWLMVPDAHADDMSNWVSIFGARGVVRCMKALADCWAGAVERMKKALTTTRGSGTRALQLEIGLAETCVIQFRSTANIVEFLEARDSYRGSVDPASRRKLLQVMEQTARRERDNARAALPLVDADPRLGFHGEAYGYLFNRELIEAKLSELDDIIDIQIPARRENP